MEEGTKKITVFIGSPRKQFTYRVMQEFIADLKALGDVEYEYVFLKDVNLGNCRGAASALTRGRSSARFAMIGTRCLKRSRAQMAWSSLPPIIPCKSQVS